ncbi:MAG: PrsW family intramembrane metalloprotease [Actinobacteria bacterium]|nr:PrsW family intramembrane metalloprotease [Actinomycetota bacterium]
MSASAPSMLQRPAAWIYLVLVAAGLFLVVPRLVLTPGDPAVVAAAWIGMLVQVAVLLLVGRLLLPKGRGTTSAIVAAALIGASFCTGAAILLNGVVDRLGLDVRLVASVNEEIVKIIAVVAVLFALRDRLRGPLDGLVIGYFVGLGFAVVENVLYAYGAANAATAWQLVITRALTSPGTHGIFTGIEGAALAYLLITRGRAWGLALAAIATVIGLHLLWDALILWVPVLVYLVAVVALYAAGIVIFLLARRMGARFESTTAGAAPRQGQAPALGG